MGSRSINSSILRVVLKGLQGKKGGEMIEKIAKIVGKVINSAKLAELEKKVLDKYESLLPKAVKPEEKKEEVKVEEV